ncbi:Site-specific recombinase, DNA invertase Pin [Desulfosarcina cetonica]|uniref:recombinase family protein n=1 Tax=Desulfosarcina cetonica TaxID=90730 RepID=UPI0006CF7F06|nr:recombinase family protein [Desulfosarcina cetonica]VTR68038.1 Site-specific recombinase, DNA invertase Pin [Desulfosarcina cetonica]
MLRSDLVTPAHLSRSAVIYIRQSTPHQVISNQESRRLQYALKQRAIDLGWHENDLLVIDSDQGITGSSTQGRDGFKNLAARVSLGQVGIILSTEVTRLSRNCSDWYPLLDVCGYMNCLIADRDGIYDPGSANGRLLLGLKGQMSEMELHMIRSRLTAGLLSKAKRGELALTLPVGLFRDPTGAVHKEPNQEVQSRLELIFATFLRVKSACKVLRFFNDQGLLIPRKNRFGDVVWKSPSTAGIINTLKNPAYAGAFVYGRTRTIRAPGKKPIQKVLPIDQWRIRVNDKYPSYISWETYEKIQNMLKDNYAQYDRNKSRGVPRPGAALVHGIVYCGQCGHKMVVQYKNSTRYICNYLRQQHGSSVCQYIPADPVDRKVVEAFFAALSPIEIDIYTQAMKQKRRANKQVNHALVQQVDRLRYEAALAKRQYMQVDPENRLVAAELERRWEVALRELNRAEDALAQDERPSVTPLKITAELKAAFTQIGQKLPDIWDTNLLSREHKKALLRCLIDKVIIHRARRDLVLLRIVWRGGATSSFDIPIPVGSLAELAGFKQMELKIVQMSKQGQRDEDIASALTAEGFRSPMHDHVLPSTVKAVRLQHGIMRNPSQSHPRQIAGYLTVPQIASTLDIPRNWIYDRITKGVIHVTRDIQTGLYLFPDKPETIDRFKKLRAGLIEQMGC